MALSYGFFNSLNGDRKYNADQLSDMFEGLITNGIYSGVGNEFIVKAAGGLRLSIGSGRARLDGKWVKNDADYTVQLNAAHVTLNRITTVVLRLNYSARTITLELLDGDNATNPIAPTPVRNEYFYDLRLATVRVSKGVAQITQANIQDTRVDMKYCGFITGLIEQVNTSELFNQYSSAFEEQQNKMAAWETQQQTAFTQWFTALTQQLQINTYIEKHTKNITLTQSVTGIDLTNDLQYAAGDVLQVFINGVLYAEGVDYTITKNATSGANMIKCTGSIESGNTVTIINLKSRIGYKEI